jgi:hypothetical protein
VVAWVFGDLLHLKLFPGTLRDERAVSDDEAIALLNELKEHATQPKYLVCSSTASAIW